MHRHSCPSPSGSSSHNIDPQFPLHHPVQKSSIQPNPENEEKCPIYIKSLRYPKRHPMHPSYPFLLPKPFQLLVISTEIRSSNRPTPLLLPHPQIPLYRRTKRRKPHTPHSRRLRPRIPRQYPPRNTPPPNPIPRIIFRSQTLNTAFCARENGADESKVAACTEGGAVHVCEAGAELGAEGEV